MKLILKFALCFCVFITSTGFGQAIANENLELETLNLIINLPSDYKIIPDNDWRNPLKIGQQFIVKNPFDFDFLVQKVGKNMKDISPFESSYFLIKSKKSRAITDDEFKHYVEKFFINWESVFKQRQEQGELSNLLSKKIIEPPIIDYEKKSIISKFSMSIGDITMFQYMYSFFNQFGNVLIVFLPLSESADSDFNHVVNAISEINNLN